jgi:hypothetical protein
VNDDLIHDLLRALAEADAAAEARPEIEMRLLAKFRSHRRRRRFRRLATWAVAPLAAVIVLLFVFLSRREAVNPPQPQEIVTDFFPLMDPAPPFERGKILRVELPASAMKMVGLPVHEEHLADSVEADVLVGEEGLPRAIRFVKFERK